MVPAGQSRRIRYPQVQCAPADPYQIVETLPANNPDSVMDIVQTGFTSRSAGLQAAVALSERLMSAAA